MKALLQVVTTIVVILAVVLGSIAISAAVLMGFFAVAAGAGFGVPAISFIDSVLLLVLGEILLGIVISIVSQVKSNSNDED